MSKTACWMYNDDTDCIGVSFGYGSRWDTTVAWVSKRGLQTLFTYDYGYDMEGDTYDVCSLHPAMHFGRDNQLAGSRRQEWLDECLPYLGLFKRENPEWSVVIDGYRPYTTELPYMEHIKEINQEHYSAIKNIEYRHDLWLNRDRVKWRRWRESHTITDEQWKEMLDEWAAERREYDIKRNQIYRFC